MGNVGRDFFSLFVGNVGRNFVRFCGYCAIVTKSWNLNFLEPFGPVHACNGTDVPLPFFLLDFCVVVHVCSDVSEKSLQGIVSGSGGWEENKM